MASCSDIWLVDFGNAFPGEPAGIRPVLVVGPPDPFVVPFVIVVPTTTIRRDLPVHVEVDADGENGLDETSYIQCEMIRSINQQRLVHRIGSVGFDTASRVTEVLKTLLSH